VFAVLRQTAASDLTTNRKAESSALSCQNDEPRYRVEFERLMVAGDRLTFYSRHENEEIVSLGVWRINMLKTMKKYVDDVRRDMERTEAKTATTVDASHRASGGDKRRADP
jgi:hypothetical protein